MVGSGWKFIIELSLHPPQFVLVKNRKGQSDDSS